MSKTNLMGFSVQELERLFTRIGEQPYRGRQLFKWLYCDRCRDFENLTTLSKELRTRLAEEYTVRGLQLERRLKSNDGSEKLLFRLEDGLAIEAVLIPSDDRNTVCISSQVGCALGCRFCATATMGLRRNLTVGEILGQLVYMRELYGDDGFSNVVFMGMGEPLQNYDNLLAALRIITDSMGLGIGAKKIAVSTAGVVPKIRRLADDHQKVRLSISLNAPNQEKRVQVMPVAGSYPLDELMDAVKYYTSETSSRVSFEYILFGGFNDTREDALELARLVNGIPCKINLIAYNPVPGLDFKRPDDDVVETFAEQLYPRTPAVTVRKSRGRDVGAACGQLAVHENM